MLQCYLLVVSHKKIREISKLTCWTNTAWQKWKVQQIRLFTHGNPALPASVTFYGMLSPVDMGAQDKQFMLPSAPFCLCRPPTRLELLQHDKCKKSCLGYSGSTVWCLGAELDLARALFICHSRLVKLDSLLSIQVEHKLGIQVRYLVWLLVL